MREGGKRSVLVRDGGAAPGTADDPAPGDAGPTVEVEGAPAEPGDAEEPEGPAVWARADPVKPITTVATRKRRIVIISIAIRLHLQRTIDAIVPTQR
jgi:hypothetical protein